MKNFVLITDSCVDLPAEFVTKLDVEVLPLSFHIDNKEYRNYLDEREMKITDFYNLLRDKHVPTTSQLTPDQFIKCFEPILAAEKDILYIGFSSALSGTVNSSFIAKDELQEKYPDRKIIIIDSLAASMGQGLLITYAANLRNQGKTIEEVRDWVEENKLKICHLFTVGDLNHLRRGGRLSYAKALIGTVLRIKPSLHVNEEGKLVQTGASRGRRTALAKLIERMKETIVNPEEQIIYISHGDCYEEVVELQQDILNQIPVKDVLINHVGPVIGSHSGLGTIAIFYLGNDRLSH